MIDTLHGWSPCVISFSPPAESAHSSSSERTVSFSASVLSLPGIFFPSQFLCSLCLKTKFRLSFFHEPFLTKPKESCSLYWEGVTVHKVRPFLGLGIGTSPLRLLLCHWSALLFPGWLLNVLQTYLLSLFMRVETTPRGKHCVRNRYLVRPVLMRRAAWGLSVKNLRFCYFCEVFKGLESHSWGDAGCKGHLREAAVGSSQGSSAEPLFAAGVSNLAAPPSETLVNK